MSYSNGCPPQKGDMVLCRHSKGIPSVGIVVSVDPSAPMGDLSVHPVDREWLKDVSSCDATRIDDIGALPYEPPAPPAPTTDVTVASPAQEGAYPGDEGDPTKDVLPVAPAVAASEQPGSTGLF